MRTKWRRIGGARAVVAFAIATAAVFGLRGEHVVRAHRYCVQCVQMCVTSMESGCEVRYPNVGAYSRAACSAGGTTCTMTMNTSCYVLRKVCSQSLCSNNDCQGGVCTTYTVSGLDASMQYSGDTECSS